MERSVTMPVREAKRLARVSRLMREEGYMPKDIDAHLKREIAVMVVNGVAKVNSTATAATSTQE